MNIKEVEKITGISSQNIRFYEKEGLVKPLRDDNNGYRVYNEDDIKLLKMIKMLRMLDMPVGDIKELLSGGNLSLCLDKQKELLEKKVSDALYAIKMCDGLKHECDSLANLDVDKYLGEMEKDSSHYFKLWLNDYKSVMEYQHKRVFTFTPDREIVDRYDFANALYDYGRSIGKEIEITKEGMYPEFIMDGEEYEACRNYTAVRGIPVSTIKCTRKGMEELTGRKKLMAIFRICLPSVIFFILFIRWEDLDLLNPAASIFLIVMMLIVSIAMSVYNYHMYWNRDYKYEDKE